MPGLHVDYDKKFCHSSGNTAAANKVLIKLDRPFFVFLKFSLCQCSIFLKSTLLPFYCGSYLEECSYYILVY